MNDYILYSDIRTKETYLEIWGGSTKHPDVTYRYSSWQDRAPWLDENHLVFQWLLYCASRLSFPFSSWELAQFAGDLMGYC